MAAYKVYMIKLGDVGALIGVAVAANDGDLLESVWIRIRQIQALIRG